MQCNLMIVDLNIFTMRAISTHRTKRKRGVICSPQFKESSVDEALICVRGADAKCRVVVLRDRVDIVDCIG